MLLKCALNGQDANWGRILCAVGYSDPSEFTVEPSMVSVSFVDQKDGSELVLLKNGEPVLPVDEQRASALLECEEIQVRVRMGQGSSSATYYTCDLSHVSHCPTVLSRLDAHIQLQEYVSINADCERSSLIHNETS